MQLPVIVMNVKLRGNSF